LASHVLPNFSTVLCVSERLDLPFAIARQMAVWLIPLTVLQSLSSSSSVVVSPTTLPPPLPVAAVLLVQLHASMPCATLFSRARVTVQQVSVMVTFFKALYVSPPRDAASANVPCHCQLATLPWPGRAPPSLLQCPVVTG
jgi:hypothetical protein